MTKPEKIYVDIRVHFSKEVEDDYTSHDISHVERKKIKGINEGELDALGESFGQLDAYHLFFQNELPLVISDGYDVIFRG